MTSPQKQFRKRNAILAYLQSTTCHPSAEMVYTELKPQISDLSIGTVYRNLNLFKQQGLAASIATVSGVERFDGNTDPHVHFICSGCDAVIDLMDMEVPQALKEAASACSGGRADDCNLSFSGICSHCLKRQQDTGESA